MTAIAAIALALTVPREADAQPSGQAAAATAEFDRGRTLMKDRKYAEACAAFEHSQKLDPQWGTLYNLAGCYAKSGKLASAWAAYRELAQRDTNAARRKESDKQARALDRRMPRLLLTAPGAPPGLVVTLDGIDVTGLVGTESPVDLGRHAIRATAPDRADFTTTTTIADEGKTVKVAIELAPERTRPAKPPAVPRPEVVKPSAPTEDPARPEPIAKAPPRKPSSDPPRTDGDDESDSPPPRSSRRMYGAIVAAGGGALIVTGLVVGRLASSKWDEAKALCGEDLTCDNQADLAAGNQLVSDAQARANLSTGLVIGGAAVVGIGVFLFATAPRSEPPDRAAMRLVPSIAPGGVSLTLVGRY